MAKDKCTMMTPSSIKGCGEEEQREVFKTDHDDFVMEEDEDLFEIDLDAVNCIIPQPPHYWESYFYTTTSSTGIALLANCLMPIQDISSAVPACNYAVPLASGKKKTNVVSLGEYLRLPFLGAIGGLLDEKTKAQFHFQFQN